MAATVMLLAPVPAHAQSTHYVKAGVVTSASGTSCAAPNFSTIEAAYADADPGDIIRVCAGVYVMSGPLLIDKSITLRGDGGLASVLDGGGTEQMLSVTGGDVVVEDLTFRNGWEASGGGAIFVSLGAASLTVRRSTFYANHTPGVLGGGAILASRMGGVGASNPLRVYDSTFVGNDATDGDADGGAINLVNGVAAHRIENSTFVRNAAGRTGGALSLNFAGTPTLSFNTFLDNAIPSHRSRAYYVVAGDLTSQGNVFADSVATAEDQCVADTITSTISDVLATGTGCGGTTTTLASLRFGPLGHFGGPTQTLLLKAGSAAIGAADAGCPDTDQRGKPRGSTCAAGAVEFTGGDPSIGPLTQIVAGRPSQAITATPAFTPSGFTGTVTYDIAPALPALAPLPSGLTFDTTTGVLDGTPSALSRATFLVTARDGAQHVSSAQIELMITNLTQQTLTVTTSAPASVVPGAGFDVAAESDADLPVVILATGACSGSGTGSATITASGEPGSCTITYDQPGGDGYSVASTLSETTLVEAPAPVVTPDVVASPPAPAEGPVEPIAIRGVAAHTGDPESSGVLVLIGLAGSLAAAWVLLRGMTQDQWRLLVMALPLLLGLVLVRTLVRAWDFRVSWLPGPTD